MTASKKLFMAALVLAAGYAAAALVGSPAPRSWTEHRVAVGPNSVSPENTIPLAASSVDQRSRVGSVRLLPERSAAWVDPVSTSESYAPSLQPLEQTDSAIYREDRMRPTLFAGADSPQPAARPEPRARLKNETPHPLPEADRPPPVFRPHSAVSRDVTSASGHAGHAVESNYPVTPAGYVADAAPAKPIIQVSSTEPLQPVGPQLVSPPPWPPAEPAPIRKHVIIDGDTLAKLAGRYLDDPRRSEELFTLNRGLLSDPELLPIGTEIRIPPRGSSDGNIREVPTRLPGVSAVHSVQHTGLAPVRSSPWVVEGNPKAQLLPPLPVE